jgi:hypothetical protein
LEHHTTFVNNLGSQNVLDVNEPVLIVRPYDGPIGPKHVALYALLMVIIDVFDENINTLFTKMLFTLREIKCGSIYIYIYIYIYTGCPRRNVPDFGRVFLMLNYTDITQNT